MSGNKGNSGFNHCAVVGCNHSYRQMRAWKSSICEIHSPEKHNDCACLRPFSLYGFPRDPLLRNQWILAVNRKFFTPSKYSCVCSVHFVDGKPSALNPCPALLLGYERKVVDGRLSIQRVPLPQAEAKPNKRRRKITKHVEGTDHIQHITEQMGTDGDATDIDPAIPKSEIPYLQKSGVTVAIQCDLCTCPKTVTFFNGDHYGYCKPLCGRRKSIKKMS